MTPDWYDLLDVPRDADKATIRAAWKAATADLDPTDRTFRVYSQAAETLLDGERRAAYDAELAAEDAQAEPASDEPVADVPAAKAAAEKQPAEKKAAEKKSAEKESVRDEPAGDEPAGDEAALGTPSSSAAAGRGLPGWLLVGMGLLTVLLLAIASILHWTAPNDPSVRAVLGEVTWWDDTDTAAGDLAVPASAQGALEAAEAAVKPLMGYDYRRLDEGQAAAQEVLTDEYAEKYDQLYEGSIRDNATEVQAVVVVTGVHASAVGRVGDGLAEVLVFFDRQVERKDRSTPIVYEDQATLTMKKVDGEWLVDDVETTPAPN